MLQTSLAEKKVDYIFEELLNFDITVSLGFFSLKLWIPLENRAKLNKLFNLNSRLRWGAKYPRCTEYTCYFFIINCSNASDFFN